MNEEDEEGHCPNCACQLQSEGQQAEVRADARGREVQGVGQHRAPGRCAHFGTCSHTKVHALTHAHRKRAPSISKYSCGHESDKGKEGERAEWE